MVTDDIDNQEAVSLARKVDPEGNRTIGELEDGTFSYQLTYLTRHPHKTGHFAGFGGR